MQGEAALGRQVTTLVPGTETCPVGIDVHEVGMVTEVRDVQPWKVLVPMEVIEDGKDTDVKDAQL